MKERDDFLAEVINSLSKRSAFICSNPDCKCLTISPSDSDAGKFLYIGKAAHITAASKGGPRFDESLTPEERRSINNAIFLCSNCADMIDKNKGLDFSVELLKTWKQAHESWVRSQLNKKKEDKQITKVISHQQSGGITAGVINFEDNY